MPYSKVQEIACQQVLVEDASVFSIQWSVFPESIAAGLQVDKLVQLYLDYVRRFTAGIIRPETTPQGVRFSLLSSRFSLITFGPLQIISDEQGSSATLYVNGGALVQPHECSRGELQFRIEREPEGIRVALQLSDYCPLLLGSRSPSLLRRWLYRFTQAAIHRLVTVRFLALLYRSLGGRAARICVVRASVRSGLPV